MTFEVDRELMRKGLEEALKHQLNIMEDSKDVRDALREFYVAQAKAFGMLRVRSVALGTDVNQYDAAYRAIVSTFPEYVRKEALQELTR